MLPSDCHTVLAIDTETHTPRLKTHGPMCIQGNDYAIGVSIAASDGFAAYYPLRHNDGNGPTNILCYLRDFCSKPTNLAIMAHAKFDMEMLWSLGIDMKCRCYDVLAVDALIDENHTNYNLDAISRRYGFEGKNRSDMEAWMVEHGIVMPHNKNKVNYGRMREVPPEIVAPYAEQDAALTLHCYQHQQTLIPRLDLEDVAKLESDLLPVLWAMRLEGVPVDIARAEQLNLEMKAQGEAWLEEVHRTHPRFNPQAAASLEEYVISFGVYPPRTDKGAPSVTNEWLAASPLQEFRDVAAYRQTEKIRRDFVEAVVLETAHKGKIHTSWASTRGIDYAKKDDPEGTRTGRIASSNPNLSQIPKRHPILGPKTRSMFKPRAGEVWHKADYSSQEPRIALHYAAKHNLEGARIMARRYEADRTLDYHQMVTDMVNDLATRKIDRDKGKMINLATIYGQGKVQLAGRLALGMDDTLALLATYHEAIPFVTSLQNKTRRYAEKHGYITTELGRRRHFDLWEPSGFNVQRSRALPRVEALAEYKFIQRAMTYKALNACVQGTAAEQIKTAMVQLHSEGLTPMITLYDELGHSIPDDVSVSRRICDVMENALPLLVPHHVEALMGDSWDLRRAK